jgi:hemerythrin-like domain-containing protein
MLLRVAPELRPAIERLEVDHHAGERRVRELQHLLVSWEFVGESRRNAFVVALQDYVRFYLQHMHVEETQLLPTAADRLTIADREELGEAFEAARDPLAGGQRDAVYERLFNRIVAEAPAPIGQARD